MPLDDVERIVRLIATVSDTPEPEVRTRLRDEVRELGTNVYNSLTSLGIPRYVASAQLDEFYRESDAFLYETTVWNSCGVKKKMRSFIGSRLDRFKETKSDVFCFGDGLGFDSARLALQGHHVRYYEPSRHCQEYAQQVFRHHGVQVLQLDSLDEIAPHSLDAVVCLDVLEHVPQPQHLVKQFHRWLKPDGLLFVHAPFWCIHWTRSTHLKENRHLSGDLKNLYHRQGFTPVDASIFWDPIVLQRTDNPSAHQTPFGGRVRIRSGQLLLAIGRWNSVIHVLVARILARAPRHWATALKGNESRRVPLSRANPSDKRPTSSS